MKQFATFDSHMWIPPHPVPYRPNYIGPLSLRSKHFAACAACSSVVAGALVTTGAPRRLVFVPRGTPRIKDIVAETFGKFWTDSAGEHFSRLILQPKFAFSKVYTADFSEGLLVEP